MTKTWLLAQAQGAGWDYHLLPEFGEGRREQSGDPSRGSALLAEAEGRGVLLGAAEAPRVALPLAPTTALAKREVSGPWTVVPRFAQAKPPCHSAGEELLIAGAMAMAPKFDGSLLVRGRSRALWVAVSAGEVVGLQATLTPSLLQQLVPEGLAGEDHPALLTAAAETLARPERLSLLLGNLDASAEAGAWDRATRGAHIAGWLFGAELAATKSWWLGQNLIVISERPDGAVPIASAQGLTPYTLAWDAALRAGLQTL